MGEKPWAFGQEIAAGASKNYLAKFLSFFFGILYLFIIARVLGPEKFGQVIYLMTIVPGFALLLGLGAMQDVVINFGSRYKDRALLRKILLLSIICSLLLSAIVAAIGYYSPAFFGNAPLPLFLLSIPLLGLFVIYSFYYSLFHAFKGFGVILKAVLLDNTANLLLAASMYYVLGWDIYAVLIARLLTYLLGIAYFLHASRKFEYSQKGGWSEKELHDYSKNILLNEVPKQLPGQLLNWLLGAFAPAKMLGEYFFAQRIAAGAIDNLYSAIRETVYPYSGENFRNEGAVKAIVSKSVRVGLLAHTLAFVALCALLFPLISFFFPDYAGSIPLVILLSLASVLTTITLSVNFFRVMGHLGDSVEITAIYGAVFSILSIALIPSYGVYGAAAARLAGGVLQIALYKRYLAKRNFVFSMVPDVADAKSLFEALASQLRGIIGMIARAK